MALTQEKIIDRIEIVGDYNIVQVRTATKVYDDGILIARNFHRHVICPSDDYSNEDAEVQAICEEFHTEQIKEAYQIWLESQGV
jgi:hypothetical protein